MKRFEYRIEKTLSPETLEILGNEGWELCTIERGVFGLLGGVIFKREFDSELLRNKKEIDAISNYFHTKRKAAHECRDYYSKEIKNYGLGYGGISSCIFKIIEEHFDPKIERWNQQEQKEKNG